MVLVQPVDSQGKETGSFALFPHHWLSGLKVCARPACHADVGETLKPWTRVCRRHHRLTRRQEQAEDSAHCNIAVRDYRLEAEGQERWSWYDEFVDGQGDVGRRPDLVCTEGEGY